MTTPNRCTALRTTRPRPAIGLGVSQPCPRRRTHANHTARSRPTTASSNTDSDQHAGDIPTPPRPTIVSGDAFVHKRHRRHYDLTHRHPSHNSDGRSAHRAHPKRSDQCPLTGLDVPTEPQYNSAQQVRVCMSSAAGSRQQGGHGGQGGTHASSRDNSRTSADDTARSGQDRFGLHGDHRLCDPYASHKAC